MYNVKHYNVNQSQMYTVKNKVCSQRYTALWSNVKHQSAEQLNIESLRCKCHVTSIQKPVRTSCWKIRSRAECADHCKCIYNVNARTIYHLQHRYNTTNSTNDRPRSRNPQVITSRKDRFILRQHL